MCFESVQVILERQVGFLNPSLFIGIVGDNINIRVRFGGIQVGGNGETIARSFPEIGPDGNGNGIDV